MLIAQRPGLAEEQVNEFRSRFVIEPLEPGFGYTIGNSLRRTLLSSIPGAAVTSIRIEGVLHEFSTIPGVTEDVTDIILNLKNLVVSSEHDEPMHMYLRKQGPGQTRRLKNCKPRCRYALSLNNRQNISCQNKQQLLRSRCLITSDATLPRPSPIGPDRSAKHIGRSGEDRPLIVS
jgi:hypothetical protein